MSRSMHRPVHPLGASSAWLAVPLLFVGACLPAFATEQGSGVAGSESRNVPAFEKVAVGGSADVVVKIGSPQSVTVRCDDNFLSRVRTDVKDGTLEVELANGSYSFRQKLVVEVVVPHLREASVRGSGDIVVDRVDEADFRASVRGSGDVRASGRADRAEVEVQGSGDVHLAELASRSAKIAIAGSGSVEVAASDKLTVDIAGSGDVRYRGEPTITRSISGSGDIVRMH